MVFCAALMCVSLTLSLTPAAFASRVCHIHVRRSLTPGICSAIKMMIYLFYVSKIQLVSPHFHDRFRYGIESIIMMNDYK